MRIQSKLVYGHKTLLQHVIGLILDLHNEGQVLLDLQLEGVDH